MYGEALYEVDPSDRPRIAQVGEDSAYRSRIASVKRRFNAREN